MSASRRAAAHRAVTFVAVSLQAKQVLQASCGARLFYTPVLQTVSGTGVGANATADLSQPAQSIIKLMCCAYSASISLLDFLCT